MSLVQRIINTEDNISSQCLIDTGHEIFDNFASDEMTLLFKIYEARIAFRLKNYDESLNIYEDILKNAPSSQSSANYYNCAIAYAWAANNKEKSDSMWNDYIDRALVLLDISENLMNDGKNDYSSELVAEIDFEKSFIYSEKDNYVKALKHLNDALNSGERHAIHKSNFNTHMWILLKNLCVTFNKDEILKTIDLS
jgi:tetratricopeptide (TPR) repeat protein